jgi:hypothetical protein
MYYGCIAASLFFAVVLIAALVGLRYAKRMFSDFTDNKPMAFPQVTLSGPEIEALQQRLETFRGAVKQGQPTGPLTLTADEINALVATDPDMKDFKGKLYVLLEGDRLKAQVSLPMADVGLPRFQGRYLNGTGTFDLVFQNGTLRLSPQSFVVKGKTLPEVYMERIRKKNFAAELNRDARAQAALEKLKEIKVADSKLHFVPK